MKKSLLAAAVIVALGAVGGAALAQVKPETLVKQRQSAMTLIGKYFGPLGGMAQGKVPYDAKIVQRNAEYLHTLAQMPWDGFDPSTKGEKSKTKAEAFTDTAKFRAAADTLEAETAKLGAAARAKNEAGVRAAFGGVAKACGSCHDAYRDN